MSSQEDNKKASAEPAAAAPDENQIIAERRGKLKAMRERGNAYPNDFRRDALAADLHAAYDAKSADELDAAPADGRGRRTDAAQARDGQGELRHAAGHERPHPALRHQRSRRRRVARRVQALGPGRHRRRARNAVQDAHRRADGQGHGAEALVEGAAAAAGEISRPDRPGAEVPAALRRPDHQSRVAPTCSSPGRRSSRRCANSSSRAAISRSRRR